MYFDDIKEPVTYTPMNINQLPKNNILLLNGEFYFNIMVHVIIMITFLHLFFKYYISKIATDIIANEFKHIIRNIFKNIDIEKYNNIDNYKYSMDTFINIINKLPQINEQLSTITFLKEKYNINNLEDLLTFIKSDGQTVPQTNNDTDSLFSIDPNKLNDMAKLFANNFNLDYYNYIFSKPEPYREKINNIVFKNMSFVNILLFIIFILFTFIMVKSKILTYGNIGYVILENCITFSIISIIEVVFFINIISKFIPTKPSSIYNLLISKFKEHSI
jgi:hypothetical protein